MLTIPRPFNKIIEIIEAKVGKYDIDKFNENISISNYHNFEVAIDKIQKQNMSLNNDQARYKLYTFLEGIDEKFYQTMINTIASYKVMEQNEIDTFISILKLNLDYGNVYTLPIKKYITDRNGLFMILESDEKISKEFGRNEKYGKKLEDRIKCFCKDNEVFNDLLFISDIGISGAQFDNMINYYENKEINENYYEYNFEILKKKLSKAKKISFLNCLYTPIYKKTILNILQEKFSIDSSKVQFLGTELTSYRDYQFNALDEVTRGKFIEAIDKHFPRLLSKKLRGQNMDYKSYIELCNSNSLCDKEAVKTLLIARRKSLPKAHQLVFENTVFNYRID